MTETNDTTPAPGGASSDHIDDTLSWFREDKASLETIAAAAVSTGFGFPEGAFRQIACDLSVLSDALQHDEGLNPEIAVVTVLGIEHRARAALALCQRRETLPQGAGAKDEVNAKQPGLIEYGEWRGTLNHAANMAQIELTEAIALVSSLDDSEGPLVCLARALRFVRAIEENTPGGNA